MAKSKGQQGNQQASQLGQKKSGSSSGSSQGARRQSGPKSSKGCEYLFYIYPLLFFMNALCLI